MPVLLGLDIGSNSVGSAWVDTDQQEVHLGVSVFPAGVDEQENKRGAPKNQARREKRSQRRNLARRSARKRRLRLLLTQAGLLPQDPAALKTLFDANPWVLRRKGLSEPLTPHEFGRVLVHLNQRRGAVGIETDPEDPDEGKVKEGIDRLDRRMAERNAATVGQLLADLMDERRKPVPDKEGKFYQDPIRNRQYRLDEKLQLYADRRRVREEFLTLWEKQKSLGGSLAGLLTDDLRTQLDNPAPDDTWRHRGVLFGQRRTYWNTGTLGRCDLEPTDRCVPVADMYAQEFRVIETANNIRVTRRGEPERALTPEERTRVIEALRRQKTGSVATIRKALGIDKKAIKEFYTLNIERDKDREINTDWFYREIVHGVFSDDRWVGLTPGQRESVNRAFLKFDPDSQEHENTIRTGAGRWWGLGEEAIERLMAAWKSRPKLEKRLNLSRRAIRNLFPYMNAFDAVQRRWPTQIEAREQFASDPNAVDATTGRPATVEQHQRYALGVSPLTKADRQFLRKHEEPLPPAPMLANPVVRKAIHEVRRHLIAWWRRFGRTPDRIVIEYVRSATQPEKVRNAALALNRKREAIRKKIVEDFGLQSLTRNYQVRAIERVLLCRQQKGMCPYCGDENPITERVAADGRVVETDHIVPMSRSQDNGVNNKVLCHRECNRGKGNQTPKEWLGSDSPAFRCLEQRLGYLEKGESPDDYFTDKNCKRKWDNLHCDAPSTGEFLASQFTDTAYAARQVGQWLREVLYCGERDGQRRVFTTKGSYTSILRNDWGLSESDLDRQWHNIVEPGEGDGDNQSRLARKQKNKNRADHVHHAIDAVCIAFAPDRLQDLARFAEEQEKARAQLGYWPRRRGVRPPWGTPEAFLRQVLSAATRLVVSHRPVKRKVSGFLHKEDLWGLVDEESRVFRIRCPVTDLNAKMLREPVEETDEQARKSLAQKLRRSGLPEKEARRIARDRVESGQFRRRLVDPSLGKGGLVRDWGLRKIIRDCLRDNSVDPDSFSAPQIKALAAAGKICMPTSGVPIKSVITIGPISDPVKIPVRDPYTRKQAINPRTSQPLFRYHISRNNHHAEILEDIQTGEWSDECVTMFESAGRVRPPRQADGTPGIARPAVNRSDRDGKRFIMSLSEDETLHMRHPETNVPGYFVVFKLSPGYIYFTPHWDARPSQVRKDDDGNPIPGSKRDEIAVRVPKLKDLGVEPGQAPVKVRVSPLGEVTVLRGD